MNNLENKVIIVTGGSGLIGQALVKEINNKGGIAINADIDVEIDWNHKTYCCDLTEEKDIKNCVAWTVKKAGRINGLVNNAYPRTEDWGTDFDDYNAESWKKNLDWQLNSYVTFCHEVINHMKKSGGAVVNIASIYGVVGNDFTLYEGTDIFPPADYTAIKGGLVNFTRFLASRYGKDKVRVNCVSPGGVFDNQPQEFVERYEKKVPLKRMANPEDIAPAVAFLLSDDAKYITGQNLLVDGGWTSI
jgi:NAD(P)-dependent dehydrogenase (short-subunit alcohol dehydrogenase family)